MKPTKFWFQLKEYNVKIVLIEKIQQFLLILFLLVAMPTKNHLFRQNVTGITLYRHDFQGCVLLCYVFQWSVCHYIIAFACGYEINQSKNVLLLFQFLTVRYMVLRYLLWCIPPVSLLHSPVWNDHYSVNRA